MFAGEFADAPADVARAGERDHRDIRINANRLARFDAPWHHLQDPFRQSSLFEYARYNESAGQRGARIGLQHDRVARRQRGSDGAHRKNQWKIEWRDDADNPARHTPGQTDAAGIRRKHQALRLGAHRGRAIENLGHEVDFETGFCRNSSGFSRDPGNQFFLILFQVTRGLSQDCGSRLIRGRSPPGLSRASFASGFSHIRRRGGANLSEPLAGRRFEDVERSSRRAAPLSAEQPSTPSALNHEFRRGYVHMIFLPLA